jgi:hypothetical protein
MVEDATGPTAPRETLMTRSLKQTMISGLAALTLGAGLLAASAPAQARPWNHGGAVAAGVIGGLAIGAMAASAAAHPVYAAPVYAVPVYDGPHLLQDPATRHRHLRQPLLPPGEGLPLRRL